MFGKAFKSCLLLSVVLLAATNLAQAKIIQSETASNNVSGLANPQALQTYLNSVPQNQPNTAAVESKTITLNFGPFHFQEVVQHPLKACPA
jgi:hypothetical protein